MTGCREPSAPANVIDYYQSQTQPSEATKRQLGRQSLVLPTEGDLAGIDTSPPVSIHDIITSHAGEPSSVVADALVNTPSCHQELITYLSDNSPAPKRYEAPLAWIRLKASLDEQDQLPGFSTERLLCSPERYVNDLENTGPERLVANLPLILNVLPKYNPLGLVQKLESMRSWDVIINNLSAIREAMPDYDAQGLVQQLGSMKRWHTIANNLPAIREAMPDYDAQGLLKQMLTTNRLKEAHIETFRPYVPNISEVLLRRRLPEAIVRSHDLQTSLETASALDDTLLSSEPDYQPLIPSGIAEFRKLRLSNYSYDCFKFLFEPLKNNTDEGEELKNKLNSLGMDTENIEMTINQAVGLATKSITSILEGKDAEESRILETTYGRKLALHTLRAKRGQWSLNLSENEIMDMITNPGLIKSSREPKVITTEVMLVDKSTHRPKLAPTREAVREATSLLRSLHGANPETTVNQTTKIRNALLAESTALLNTLQSKAEPGTELAKRLAPQIQKAEKKIALLQEISIDPDNTNDSLSQLAQFDTKNREIIQAIRSALISSAMPNTIVPENIKNLRNITDIESHQLTPEQISSLGEFFNHHIVQEFWERRGLIITSSGASAIRTPSIKNWEDASLARDSSSQQQTSGLSLPVKFIANSSPFIRTVAGAMGDACYSQNGEKVPESADVITMTNEDATKILGNFLLLDSEYVDENNTPQKIKVLRAVNPLDSTLKRYPAKSMVGAIIEVSKQLLPEGYKLAVIIDKISNIGTTNRPTVLAALHSMRELGEIEKLPLPGVVESVNFNGYNSTNSVYLVQQ